MPGALQVWLWAIAALVMRGSVCGFQQSALLIELLQHEVLGQQAAAGFRIILAESSIALQPATGAIVTLLYKQRFFLQHKDSLVTGYKRATDAQKGNYLHALAHLLANVPKLVLQGELPALFPLLVEATQVTHDDVKLSCLDILDTLVVDAPEFLADRLSELLPQYLTLCTHPVSAACSPKRQKTGTLRKR